MTLTAKLYLFLRRQAPGAEDEILLQPALDRFDVRSHLTLGAARTRTPAPAATTLRLPDFGGAPPGLKASAAAFSV